MWWLDRLPGMSWSGSLEVAEVGESLFDEGLFFGGVALVGAGIRGGVGWEVFAAFGECGLVDDLGEDATVAVGGDGDAQESQGCGGDVE
jgi:hypothetical protein